MSICFLMSRHTEAFIRITHYDDIILLGNVNRLGLSHLQRCQRRKTCSYSGWPHFLSWPWWSWRSAGEHHSHTESHRCVKRQRTDTNKKKKSSSVCLLLTFSSMIHRREMKSRSNVTKRQKVRRTSEMALRSAGGTNRYGDGMDRVVE